MIDDLSIDWIIDDSIIERFDRYIDSTIDASMII